MFQLFQFFPSLSNITSVTSSAATREVAAEDVTEVMLLREGKKWKSRNNEYVTYHNTMAALTAIIIDSCPYIYYMVLHYPDLGYSNCTPR